MACTLEDVRNDDRELTTSINVCEWSAWHEWVKGEVRYRPLSQSYLPCRFCTCWTWIKFQMMFTSIRFTCSPLLISWYRKVPPHNKFWKVAKRNVAKKFNLQLLFVSVCLWQYTAQTNNFTSINLEHRPPLNTMCLCFYILKHQHFLPQQKLYTACKVENKVFTTTAALKSITFLSFIISLKFCFFKLSNPSIFFVWWGTSYNIFVKQPKY